MPPFSSAESESREGTGHPPDIQPPNRPRALHISTPTSSSAMDGREFPDGAREKCWHCCPHQLPLEHDGGCAAAGNTHHQELWAGVLGVVLEGAKAQEEWGPVACSGHGRRRVRGPVSVYNRLPRPDRSWRGCFARARGICRSRRCAWLHPPSTSLPGSGRAEMTQLLLQKGADAEKPGSGGTTPAFMAASHGFAAAVRVEPWSR